jgi:thiol:disulfide interchange protein
MRDVPNSFSAGLRFLRQFAAGCVLALLAVGMSAHAGVVKTPHVEAELIARHATFIPGQPIEVALRLKIIDHWHTYWRNPGDSGLPTRLKWTLPEGFVAGEIEWPYPKKLPLGPLMNFGYEGEVLHLVSVTTPSGFPLGQKLTLSAKAEWLVCADVCIPEDGVVSLSLTSASSLAPGRWESAFVRAREAVPSKVLNDVTGSIDGMTATLSVRTPAVGEGANMAFFPFRDDLIANAAKQVFTKTDSGFTLTVPLASPRIEDLKLLDGILVAEARGQKWGAPYDTKAVVVSAPVRYTGPATAGANSSTGGQFQAKMAGNAQPDLGLAAAILFAFLGGLILNLMPCVFPVLGIKVMGFVENAHGDAGLLRRQGVVYLVGVLLSFLLLAGIMLALRGGGQSVGWGFQMQEPAFVAALALLFFLMALNLSGVFEIGASLQSAAGSAEQNAQSSPLKGAFVSGVLATVVATPCMAPGLGASIGYTLGQSSISALLIFTAMAIGLALPLVLLSFFPAWLRFLPKPGAWMETFKQLMAFPLYATVVWLIWILGAQTGNDGVAKVLVGLTLLALAAWIYGRWQMRRPRRAIAFAAAITALAVGISWSGATTVANTVETSTSSSNDWVPFSVAKIAALRAEGKSVFVDFTATWCITCQVNKRVALNDAEVVRQMAAKNVVRMEADWTKRDTAITEALASFGRNGVPLYVLYPPTGEAALLPELLTPGIVLDAIAALPATTSSKTAAR